MTDRTLGLLLVLAAAALCAAVASSVVSCEQSVRAREAAEARAPVEVLGVGPGYPAAKNFTIGSDPVLVDAADFGGIAVISLLARNTTTNACHWGHGDVDAGVGSSHCTSGCDTSAPMGGDYRELYIDCDASSTVRVHAMLTQRYTE